MWACCYFCHLTFLELADICGHRQRTHNRRGGGHLITAFPKVRRDSPCPKTYAPPPPPPHPHSDHPAILTAPAARPYLSTGVSSIFRANDHVERVHLPRKPTGQQVLPTCAHLTGLNTTVSPDRMHSLTRQRALPHLTARAHHVPAAAVRASARGLLPRLPGQRAPHLKHKQKCKLEGGHQDSKRYPDLAHKSSRAQGPGRVQIAVARANQSWAGLVRRHLRNQQVKSAIHHHQSSMWTPISNC